MIKNSEVFPAFDTTEGLALALQKVQRLLTEAREINSKTTAAADIYKYSQGVDVPMNYEHVQNLIASHREMLIALMYIRRYVPDRIFEPGTRNVKQENYNGDHIDKVIARAANATK